MKKSKKISGRGVFLYMVGLLCVAPAALVVLHSFMGDGELLQNFHFVPKKWTLLQYDRLLFTQPEYYAHFWNTIRYTAAVLLPGLAVSMLGGYGFATQRFRWKKGLFALYLVLMLMPFQATLVPQYLLLQKLHLLDTGWAIILPNIFNPFGTILVAQYMEGIDADIFDAGKLDGLGGTGLFLRIALPLCVPAIGSWLILTFLDCWAMLEQPLGFLQDVGKYPLSVRLSAYSDGRLFAGSAVYMILPLLLFRTGKEALVEGIGFGSIK